MYIFDQSLEYQQALQELRKNILEVIPDSEQCISYNIPTFKVDGKWVAGFGAYKKHLTFFPFGGHILDHFEDELVGYTRTTGGLHFTPDKPIPKALLKKIIKWRLEKYGK